MASLRIAAVQLDYQPVTRTTVGGWRLDEPLSPVNPLAEPLHPEHLLGNFRNQYKQYRDIYEKLMAESRQSYTINLTKKLREIMTYCFRHSVDIVLFPEYSIPVAALDALRSFSTRMAVIAGLGYLQRQDIETLRKMELDVQHIAQANNVAIVLSPSRNFVVSKKNPAESEFIQVGSGPQSQLLTLPKGAFTIGIAICLDFIREGTLLHQQNPDIVTIPALSQSIREFVKDTPRDYIRIFANHAAFGGTYIGAPLIKGLKFADRDGTIPLKPGIEGIVIVDWDYENPWPVKPTSTRPLNHKLYARSSIVYKGRDSEIAQAINRIDEIPDKDIRQDDFLQFSREVHTVLERQPNRYELVREAVDTIDEGTEILTADEQRAFSRHLVLSSEIISVTEWKYKQHVAIARQLKRLQDQIPDLAISYSEYETNAREIVKDVRTSLVEVHHKGTILSESGGTEQPQIVFFAVIGAYSSDEAKDTLTRQLTLLRTIAELQDPKLSLSYRLQCRPNDKGIMHAIFEVVCVSRGHSQQEVEELRQGLGQLIHVTFMSAYSMHYTTSDFDYAETVANFRESSNWWAEIANMSIGTGKVSPIKRTVDWSLIIDLLRSLNTPAFVEMQCSAPPPEDNFVRNATSTANEVDFDNLSPQGHPDSQGTIIYQLSLEKDEFRRLSIRLFIGSEAQLPKAVTNAIGIEFTGTSQFELIEKEELINENVNTHTLLDRLSPSEALKVFHVPYGELHQTTKRRINLNISADETDFPPTGILLGKARIRQIRSDEEIDVTISEADRLRHLYVVGKTGTGKTNLLKNMASQDVKIPGRGVTIIDPHGDLVDHVLREIPDERVGEVTLIDLARTDALPILNPLDLNRKDIKTRDRTIQELLLLLRQRVFHQYTGPRFDELVRLAFLTMLDEGYTQPASVVEIARLFEDNEFQRAAVSLIKNEEIKKRWDFQDTVTRSSDYGELIHWVTSKFDDIAQDSILRCVMGGAKSTLKVEQIVQDAGILLVRIPEAVIGKQAADFIGSLILLQLKMAIIRRREFGKLQHYHFVYVDEFQNFANTDFHTLVAEARKFNIGFTLANQNLEQLREFRSYTGAHEQRLINAIFGNVANIVVFGVGTFDASFLSSHFDIPARDILRIGRYEALAKVLVNGFDSSAFTLRTTEAILLESPRNLELIEKRMQETCWVNPSETLKEILLRPASVIASAPKPPAPDNWLQPRIFRDRADGFDDGNENKLEVLEELEVDEKLENERNLADNPDDE